MRSLTLFYDDQCAFCRSVKTWLDGVPKYVPIRTVPYASPEAQQIFPEIWRYQPDREILALADNGGLHLGGDAWIMCLWATRSHRPWARRLSSPALRPLAKKVAGAVASHRYSLSKFMLQHTDRTIADGVELALRKPSPYPTPFSKSASPQPVPVADYEAPPAIACACELDPHELTAEELAPLREAHDLADPL